MQETHLSLDHSNPGRIFDGIGGNFRLQNPTADPPAIQYNLDHLPLAWGRVAMPLNHWIPGREPGEPVRAAMEMARELARRNIPVIASTWVAPDWALAPETNGLRGRPILPEKSDALCAHIASYLLHLRDHFACDTEFFSFNESNLGIDIRQTPQEHAEMIKRLGREFLKRGLKTKQLLGDTSNATSIDFIRPAMADREAMKHIGALSFHSWHGGADPILAAWSYAADELNLPLFCAEAGTDPAAYKNPPIFEDDQFALNEINLYIRICALCQPASLLQWQMTSDYPLVIGSPPRPVRRFWQWKQLALTPPGAAALPIQSDSPEVSCCAFQKGDQIIIHVVNTGPARTITLSGLPTILRQFRARITSAQYAMSELPPIQIAAGACRFALEKSCYVTVD